jgi:hypothetical protein
MSVEKLTAVLFFAFSPFRGFRDKKPALLVLCAFASLREIFRLPFE